MDQAAKAFSLSRSGYVKVERAERKLSSERVEKASEIYGVPTSDVIGDAEPEVPIVGYVGAGSERHLYDAADNPDEYQPAPPNASASTVGVHIRGESMGPLLERMIVYYDDVRDPVTPDLFGEVCVVGLEDGRVLIKRLQKSKTRGLYHLVSNNEGTMTDVAVKWAAKVKAILPKR